MVWDHPEPKEAMKTPATPARAPEEAKTAVHTADVRILVNPAARKLIPVARKRRPAAVRLRKSHIPTPHRNTIKMTGGNGRPKVVPRKLARERSPAGGAEE